MQFVLGFCVLTVLFSFTLCFKNPEDPLGIMDSDTQTVEYNLQEPSDSVSESERFSGLQRELNERNKIHGLFRVMLSAYSKNPRAFHYYPGYPLWKNGWMAHGLPKTKRLMGVAVSDFLHQPKKPGSELDGDDEDLGEGGDDVGSGGTRRTKVKLLGRG